MEKDNRDYYIATVANYTPQCGICGGNRALSICMGDICGSVWLEGMENLAVEMLVAKAFIDRRTLAIFLRSKNRPVAFSRQVVIILKQKTVNFKANETEGVDIQTKADQGIATEEQRSCP